MLVKGAALLFFHREGADDAHARQIFAHGQEHPVELGLHLFIEGDAGAHHRIDGNGKERDDGDEDERNLRIDGERHRHRAEDDEGRTQKEAQRHVDARLHLVDVARHAGDHRGGAHFVDLRKREGLQFAEEAGTKLCRTAHRSARREELPRNGEGAPDKPHAHKHEAHEGDELLIPLRNALVDDEGDDEGGDKFEARLQKLEKGR